MEGVVGADFEGIEEFGRPGRRFARMVRDGPARSKNFFLLCGADVLAHKPGLIVTVSAGTGGSYPVTELRISSYKNTRLCYIPDHVIVRNVGQMLHGDQAADEHDAALRGRITYSLRVLVEYAKALRLVRESGVIDLKAFPHGM